jgi:hypothetical protein
MPKVLDSLIPIFLVQNQLTSSVIRCIVSPVEGRVEPAHLSFLDPLSGYRN